MASRQKHRLMLYKLSQVLGTEHCANLGRFYELPAAFYDDINKGSPGLKLIRALEQRRIICEDDLTILKAFVDILNEYDLQEAAKIVTDCYPNLARGSAQGSEVTESGAPVTCASDSKKR